MKPEEFLPLAVAAAVAAKHPFPDYAACESALESAWGESKLAKDDLNLFGTKAHTHPIYETVNLPTREFLNNQWVVVAAKWVKYPSWAASFEDRIATLRRLAPVYPHYAAALAAKDGETFVREVSVSWSTDPARADKCLAIHATHFSDPIPDSAA